MKKIRLLCAILLLHGLVASATNYYADPSAAGSMSNPGTFNAPWASLSSIFSANKTFVAGDTIFLRTGRHGYAIIRGINTGYVVIMPQPGESPVVDRIRISATAAISAAYWKLFRLTVQSEATGNMASPSYTLLEIYPFATNIIVSECTITSNLNTDGWTRDDWRNRCNSGLSTRGKLNANYLIENNLILNTAFGLTISSSNTIVRGNTVRNFTNDGSRVLGSNILFENNRVTDLIKVMTKEENHDDLFQAFTYAAGGTGQDTLKDDIIRNNIFITTTDTSRAFCGASQGIGCFDGVFLRWTVENNIVLTDHWHGISLYGAVDCKVLNNTVMDPYKVTRVDPYDQNSSNIGPAWILISKKSNGPPSSNNLVKNNLVANVVTFSDPSMGVGSNNLILGALSNFSNYFVDVQDFGHPDLFDLHLKPGSPAIDAGDTLSAPAVDYDGVARPQGAQCDVGAYEFVVATAIAETESLPALRIYPNPSDGVFHLAGLKPDAGAQVMVYNNLGVLVKTSILQAPAETIDLDLRDLATAGIYFVIVKQEGQALRTATLVLAP